MLRALGRAIVGAALVLSSLCLIAAVAVLVLTRTSWGHERIRRIAEHYANGAIHGTVTIGDISGDIITGLTAKDVIIRDSSGAPFVALESITARYGLSDLIHKRLWFRDAVIVRPIVVLDRKPGADTRWNWQRIFASSTKPGVPPTGPSWGAWIRFVDSRVIGGTLVVRSPWGPPTTLTASARDSLVRNTLAGNSRLAVIQVPGGYQKVVTLDSLTTDLPLVRLADPSQPQRLIRVASLRMRAMPFRPPAIEVVNVSGTFPFSADSLWWTDADLRLAGSHVTGRGSYAFASGNMNLSLAAPTAAFSDFRWLYPRLPSTGGGSLDLALTWQGDHQDYLATNASLATGGATIHGSFGLATAPDTLTLHDTDLRFTGLDTRLIEQLVAGFKSPRRGTLAGSARLAGGRTSLHVDADVAFDDQRSGTSRVVALGTVAFPGKGLSANDLHLTLEPVQVDLARIAMPSLPIGGSVTGTALVNGSTTSQLTIAANVEHHDGTALSRITGTSRVALSGSRTFVLDATVHPLALAEAGKFAPAVGLRGSATGPVHITGLINDFNVNSDLRLSDGGRLAATGHLDLRGAKAYDVVAGLYTLNLNSILTKAPQTSLTARATVSGTGTSLATMSATVAADISTSRWDTVAIDTASVRATVANGMAQIPMLYASGYHTAVNASGSFGLVRGTDGLLAYRAAVDSLGALDRWIPGIVTDTAAVPPRPALVAAAYAKARADSTRIANATEVERAISGAPPPKLHVVLPRTVKRDTIGGTLRTAGTLRGNLYDFTLRGNASGENVTARGDFVRRFRAEYAWTNARTPQSELVAGLDADSVMASGFALDTVAVRVAYRAPGGHAEVLIRQGLTRDYTMAGDFVLATARSQATIANVRLRLDTTLWTTPHAATIKWGGPGIEVDSFEIRDRAQGRVFANGLLPTKGVARFEIAVNQFPIVDVTDLLQSDLPLTGLVTLDGAMTGTLENPAFRAVFGITGGTYQSEVLPNIRGRVAYADKDVNAHVDATRADGALMATVDGQVPINLAMSGVTGPRMLHAPMSVKLSGDSIPIDLIPTLTTAVSNVRGRAAGTVEMGGYYDKPVLVGGLALSSASLTISATGMALDDLNARIRMANDTVYVDSLAGLSHGPVFASGTIAVGDWRTPTFDLKLGAQDAYVLENAFGRLRADAALTFTGPFSRMRLAGTVAIKDGVINGPENTGKHVIAAGDPDIFQVVDTANATERDLFPNPSPIMTNLHMDVSVTVAHDTWVRTHDANIEIFTEDPITVRGVPAAPALTGAVTTDRGDYTFLSKRFQVTRGSALFPGGRTINPTLQITGEYKVQIPGSPETDIKVLIGGTLQKPKLSLESDAQPPRSESELLSLLAFGRSASSLLATDGSSISPGGSGLVGIGAEYAVRRLADVAFGVVIDELQTKAGRALGTDYLNITPADVPTEIAQGQGIATFLQQTQIEAGKYVNPRTFVEAQTVGGFPGLRIQYRTNTGWIYEGNSEPHLLLLPPTLSEQPFRTREGVGLIIVRQWRF